MKSFSLNHFLKKQSNQFYISIFLRSLAIGMILIFEPIYLYSYFNQSLPLTLIFFAFIHGIYAFLAVLGAKVMSKIGFDWAMLISSFFFLAYYIFLAFINFSFLFIFLAIIMKALAMALFWPSYHINFTRFSKKDHRGTEVSKKNIAVVLPSILGPTIGGIILFNFNYPFLFASVLIVLLISAIPLFMTKEKNEVYNDGYREAWGRIFKKRNLKSTIAFSCTSIEEGVNAYLWPLFMSILSISYLSMGGIVSFSFFISMLFMLYMGKISNTSKKVKALNIGSLLTSLSWIIKFFVVTPFSAFLAHIFYRVCKTSVSIPFQTFFYGKAARRGPGADEFLIYREIIINLIRFLSLSILALIFLIIPQINIAFIIAALSCLGFVFIGKSSKIKKVI